MQVDFSLYLISDRHRVHSRHDLLSAVEAALKGGVRAVQLREKDLSSSELFALGSQLRQITQRYDARLLINDRIDIALAIAADGVHLTEQSLSVTTARQLLGDDKLIAVSTHSLNRALDAQRQGADFITFSPIYHTPSKADYGEPQGLEKLQQVCAHLTIPVFALGGISLDRVAPVKAAGAAGVALIAAIMAQPDPQLCARQFLSAPQ